MRWQKVFGWSRRQVEDALMEWGGIKREGARSILLRGHAMLRAAIRGADPQMLWPGRFSQVLHNPRWSCTLPPRDSRHGGDGSEFLGVPGGGKADGQPDAAG